MVHCFAIHGTKLVLDVHSQTLHEVDDLAWAVLSGQMNGSGEKEAVGVPAVLQEIEELRAQGRLFAPDPYADYEPPSAQVKALCLNVAQHCNLACRYCFARPGFPEKAGILMSPEIARRAVDWLMVASGARRHVEIDFFGGEPLLNFPVVRETVYYARERAQATGKEVGFTLTTNGLLLTRDVRQFFLEQGVNVVVSLDGRPEVHDLLRRTPEGRGSHKDVLDNLARFKSEWEAWKGPRGYYYIRGTFTRHNLDFANDFRYLAELGLVNISLEPVVAPPGAGYAFREADLPRIREEYERLADIYLQFSETTPELRYFHFEIDLDEGPCMPKLLSGCGAGHAYLAVDVVGDLYPCHQFTGRRQFLLGNIFEARLRQDLVESFRMAHVYAKEGCRDCWAKFLCSGGCHAQAFLEHQSILRPSQLGCVMMRHRLECALYIQAKKAQNVQEAALLAAGSG